MAAIGFLEVHGYGTAMHAMDQACKAAEVSIEGIDVNNPLLGDGARIPIIVQVKFSGNVSNVRAALDAAHKAARLYNDEHEIKTHFIANAAESLQPLIARGKVVKKC
ncbi:MAG: BMC domain-containing protein [Turicibacter sp.]|nr:BMC domain-containing protein [Turicibacter sp.]